MSGSLIDISVALRDGMPTWPGSPGVRIERHQAIAEGADANASLLRTDVHCGTHVDAPDHFLGDGDTIESLDLQRLVGPADVVDARGHDRLDGAALGALAIPDDCRRLLLRTRDHARWVDEPTFDEGFTGLDESGAQWVADHGLALIGIDYLGIQAYVAGPETHRTLLRHRIAILEGIELAHVTVGRYELVCLPILVTGAEAAPARAILRPLEDR